MDFPEGWLLNRQDLEILSELRDEVWSWRRQADDPYTLLGVSAMAWGFDQIITREEVGAVLTVRFDNYHFSGADGRRAGSEVYVSMSSEGIELGAMMVEAGDHSSRRIAYLTQDGGFSDKGVQEWLNLKSEVGGALSAEIDALSIGL